MRHGKGYEQFENGNVYIGEFSGGKAHGENGSYIWKNGDRFEGAWVNGLKEGRGKWISHLGESYEGEWHRS